MKRGFLFILAFAMAVSALSACGNADKADGITPVKPENELRSDETIGLQEMPPTEPETMESESENTAPILSENAVEVINKLFSDRDIKVVLGEATDENGKYGEVSTVGMTVGNEKYLFVTEFESEEKAAAYASFYDSTGCYFTAYDGEKPVESCVIDYVAPVHFWRYNKYIINYASETGEYLQMLNSVFGYEFAGAGPDLYNPDYAKETIASLGEAGYFCTGRMTTELEQLYIVEPESICELRLSETDVVYLRLYATVAQAADHAARFSRDGKIYSGLGGDDAVSILFGRQSDMHLFRKDNLVAEYCGTEEGIILALDKVLGYQFAGADYLPVSSEYVDFSCEYIRTDGYVEGFEYPQYAVIRSKEELWGYYNEYKNMFFLDHCDVVYSDTTIGFLDAADNYTSEWFEENDLVLIVLEHGSGSYRDKVTNVTKDINGVYTVEIETICPEVFTCDMAEWHLFLHIKDGKLNPLTKINIVSRVINMYMDE